MVFYKAPQVPADLFERFPPTIVTLLREIGDLAQALGSSVYLVGGAVRDLLLGRENFDLDFVVEGDGVAFAEAFTEQYGGTVKRYRQFGTATVLLPEGFKFDVATARKEAYERPAALPRVKPGSLEEDLFRRDFTINAMAVSLNPGAFGSLIDPFRGREDLERGIIRVLHERSYLDDPTRIFRAIRFEARYRFTIAGKDEGLIREAVRGGFLLKLSPKRRGTELLRLLEEPDPLPPLKRLEELGVLGAFHPKLIFKEELFQEVEEVFARMEALLPENPSRPKLLLLTLLAPLSLRSAKVAGRRLGLPPKLVEELLLGLRAFQRIRRAFDREKSLRPSLIHRLRGEAPSEALLLAASEDGLREVVIRYFNALKNRVHLKGEDLRALGFPPGPLYRRILKVLHTLKLDGHLQSLEDELRYVKERFGHLIPGG